MQLPPAAGTAHSKSSAGSGGCKQTPVCLQRDKQWPQPGEGKGTYGQSVGKEAVTACRRDAFRWRLLRRNICQDVHPVQLLPSVGVSKWHGSVAGSGRNLPVCRAGTQDGPVGPKCQIWPNGKKFLQNANVCGGIQFSLLCADMLACGRRTGHSGDGSGATLAQERLMCRGDNGHTGGTP